MLRLIDPFEQMDRMLGALDRGWSGGMMPMDAYEQEGELVLRFDLPGIDPEHVEVAVEDKVLTVTAERPAETTPDDVTWMLRERPTGSHRREIRLGDRLDADKISASFDSGVLTVTIPVKAEARPRKIAIESAKRHKLTSKIAS